MPRHGSMGSCGSPVLIQQNAALLPSRAPARDIEGVAQLPWPVVCLAIVDSSGWGEASLSCGHVVLRPRLLDRPGHLLRVLRPPDVLPNAPAPSIRAGPGSDELLHRRPALGPDRGSPRRAPPEPPLRRDRSGLAHRPFGPTPAAVLVGERVDRSGHRRRRPRHRPPSGWLAPRDDLLGRSVSGHPPVTARAPPWLPFNAVTSTDAVVPTPYRLTARGRPLRCDTYVARMESQRPTSSIHGLRPASPHLG